MSWSVPPTIIDHTALARYVNLHSAQIPISFYNVTTNNNTLVVDGVPYVVAVGNYDANQLITALHALLPGNWVITINEQTNKFTLNHNNDFTINGTSSMLRMLGFNPDEDVVSPLSPPHEVTSTHCCNLAGPSRLTVRSNLLTENFMSDAGTCNVLASIPVSSTPGTFIYYSEVVDTDMALKNTDLSFIEVDIEDEDGNLMHFNGVDVLLHIQVDEIVDVSHVSERIPLPVEDQRVQTAPEQTSG